MRVVEASELICTLDREPAIDWGQCPACELAGMSRERALREAPRYMAALDALPPGDIPDEPRSECWDCRRLRAHGHDPRALAAIPKGAT